MAKCGIRIVGRSRKLKINYRTTEQICRFATSVLDGQPIDDLDEGNDNATAYRSLTRGPVPEFKGFGNLEDETKWIADTVGALCRDETEWARCCVMLRIRRVRDEYACLLNHHGLAMVVLENRADNQAIPGVRIATMHRVKGLEFRHVFLAGMNSDEMPNRYAVHGSEDPAEIEDNEVRECA